MKIIYCNHSVYNPGGMERVMLNKIRWMVERLGWEVMIVTTDQKGRPPFYPVPEGVKHGGYYMSTDIGYLRFIFYFGVVGLLAFSYFFYRWFCVCYKRAKSDGWLFFLFLLLNFAVWFKVSTDIFLVFALFLFVDREQPKNQSALS